MPEILPSFDSTSPQSSEAGLNAARKLLSNVPFRPVVPALEFLLAQDLGRLFSVVDGNYPAAVLERFGIHWDCSPDELSRIPVQGPAIVVANHPFGLVDGAVILAMLGAIRPDIRLLANSMLAAVPQLEPHIIPVDNFGGVGAEKANLSPLRKSMRWLRDGGMLVVFPAGEVASVQFGGAESLNFGVRDAEWNVNAVRLARQTESTIVPLYFHGSNSMAFHLAGLMNPQLRMLLLPHEFMNKTGTRIHVSVGAPISAKRLARDSESDGDSRRATAYVRARTHVLHYRALSSGSAEQESVPATLKLKWATSLLPAKTLTPVAAPANPIEMFREIVHLPAAQCLLQQSENQVWVASAAQIPNILHEIGRLREVTFRGAGEGTGTALDLDQFDAYYQHLFIWNNLRNEVVGAYRLAGVQSVIRAKGVDGLYTGTLFHLHSEFYDAIQPALELGRSFIRIEYQKSYHALLMLWKGLGHYVNRHPHFRVLFGPVSISQNYSEASRALMVSYLREKHANPELARFVQPRKKFKTRLPGELDSQNFASLMSNLDELSSVIADIEPDGKGLPILLQHYLNLGGQIVDFSVDKKFSGVLDGLIVVDLPKTGRRSLERYMGKANAESYLRRHSLVAKNPVMNM